jgi:hypothetical protein
LAVAALVVVAQQLEQMAVIQFLQLLHQLAAVAALVDYW